MFANLLPVILPLQKKKKKKKQVWLLPLEKMPKLVTPAEIRDIFSELQAVYQFNSTLLESIEIVVSDWHTTSCLGEVFLQIVCGDHHPLPCVLALTSSTTRCTI